MIRLIQSNNFGNQYIFYKTFPSLTTLHFIIWIEFVTSLSYTYAILYCGFFQGSKSYQL